MIVDTNRLNKVLVHSCSWTKVLVQGCIWVKILIVGDTNRLNKVPMQSCSWTKVLIQGCIWTKILIVVVVDANRLNKVLVHSCSWANRRALTYFQRWHWPQLCTWVLLWGEDKCFVYYGSERPIFWNYKFVWVAFQIIVQLLHLFPNLFVGSAIGSIAA